MNPHILAFLLVWQLIARGHNHVVLTKEDLILMYFIMSRIKVNWIYVMKDHMNKSKKLTDYIVPYVVLVSKFIVHFGVDLEGELIEIVKARNEITCAILHNIGLMKLNDDHWICRLMLVQKDKQVLVQVNPLMVQAQVA